MRGKKHERARGVIGASDLSLLSARSLRSILSFGSLGSILSFGSVLSIGGAGSNPRADREEDEPEWP